MAILCAAVAPQSGLVLSLVSAETARWAWNGLAASDTVTSVEMWQIRWNKLVDELNADASDWDSDFVAISSDGEGTEVVIYRSAPTVGELAAWYTARVRKAGFGEPAFREVPVSRAAWEAVKRVMARADAALMELGIIVWRMQPKGIGQTIVASYEDPRGNGLPQFLLDDLAQFPPSTIEFHRVNGSTQFGA